MLLKKKEKITQNNDDNIVQKTLVVTKYNILILIDKLAHNDVSLYVAKLSNYLFKNNVGVVILTGECKIRNLINNNILVITNNSVAKGIIFNQNNIKLIQHTCNTYSIDIINAFTINMAYLAYNVVKKNKNLHYISTILDIYSFLSDKNLFFDFNIVNNGEKIICCDDYISNYLIDKYHTNEEIIEINRNGIDIEEFKVNNVKKWRIIDTIEIIGTNIDNKTFTYPCDFKFNYNDIMFLLGVLSKIEKQHYKIILFGNFTKENKQDRINIVDKIYSLKLNDKVILVDKFADSQPLYLLSYAIIKLSSRDLCFDNSILEVYASKKPVIATDNQPMNRYVINTKTGFLVRKNGFYETKKAIEDMLNLDTKTYQTMCENAYNYVCKHFDINKNFSKLDEIFYNICK